MKKIVLIAIPLVLLVAIWYALSPDGALGYDEGTRLAAYTSRAVDKFQRSSDNSATFTYTPKYGNDQALTVEFTQGQNCSDSPAGCSGTIVVVHVSKGKSGAGYSLGHSAAVPSHLYVNKAQGPIQVELRKQDGVAQIVALH